MRTLDKVDDLISKKVIDIKDKIHKKELMLTKDGISNREKAELDSLLYDKRVYLELYSAILKAKGDLKQ